MKTEKRGDLRQLAPRKKLLKTRGVIADDKREIFYRKPSCSFLHEGFFILSKSLASKFENESENKCRKHGQINPALVYLYQLKPAAERRGADLPQSRTAHRVQAKLNE
ncbi:MAG: hypothetical protein ACR2LT_07100 [Pyrinomonadaceae bacterium]